jgi:hypothetical protein
MQMPKSTSHRHRHVGHLVCLCCFYSSTPPTRSLSPHQHQHPMFATYAGCTVTLLVLSSCCRHRPLCQLPFLSSLSPHLPRAPRPPSTHTDATQICVNRRLSLATCNPLSRCGLLCLAHPVLFWRGGRPRAGRWPTGAEERCARRSTRKKRERKKEVRKRSRKRMRRMRKRAKWNSVSTFPFLAAHRVQSPHRVVAAGITGASRGVLGAATVHFQNGLAAFGG